MRHGKRKAFTLVEILVVIAIVMLASIVALPVLSPLLNGRHMNEAARTFTASLAGVKDAAIRANEPRGLRLLPDPTLTLPALGNSNAGTLQLAYNRMVPIEPAADYSEGRVLIGPQVSATAAAGMTGWPPAYPRGGGNYSGIFPLSGVSAASVLMVEESPFNEGYKTPGAPNDPCNWYWNIRLGDKIQVGGSGQLYTVVGPCTINPWNTSTATQGNPELFVNVGFPGTTPPLIRTYYPTTGQPIQFHPEFLFVVNGQDDNTNGWVDEGWDGYDQNANGVPDDLAEWTAFGEPEKWTGTRGNPPPDLDPFGFGLSPSVKWLNDNPAFINDIEYTIQRRPVPTPGAREIFLPASVVIDATTWNSTQERSRMLIEQGSLYADIMMNPNGQFIATTAYSSPASYTATPFFHFWLTDRGDVYPRGSVWGTGTSGPNANPSNTATQTFYELPMTTDAMGFDPSQPSGLRLGPGFYPPSSNPSAPKLENDRALVTINLRSGLVTTNGINTSIPTVDTNGNALLPGEGFNVSDVGYPFYWAQQGAKTR